MLGKIPVKQISSGLTPSLRQHPYDAKYLIMNKRFSKTVFETIESYLEHCRKKLQPLASEFCNLLDKELKPVVFLFAVDCRLPAPKSIIHAVPENIDYSILVNAEEKLIALINKLGAPNNQRIDPRPPIVTGLIGKSFSDFLNKAGMTVYLSETMLEDEFVIFAVCSVLTAPIASRYSLSNKNKAAISLIDGALKNFVKAIPSSLFEELSPGALFKGRLLPSSYEILRTAAKDLVTRISFNIPPLEKIEESLPILEKQVPFFEDINAISRMRYENEKALGNIIIARKDHPSLNIWMEFENPVWTHNHRASRKLLEISDPQIGLLVWNGEFYGLGSVQNSYDISDEGIFRIEVRDHYTWSLHHGGHNLMIVSYEQPRLEKDEDSDYVEEFKKILQAEFNEQMLETDNLLELFRMALEQPHGTMLVVSSQAASEAARLQTQSTVIKPANITGTIMKRITSIDGAVIVDPKGICYAIGVILDGVIEKGEGDPSRGARFNAAFKYLSHCRREKIACSIAVFSEDGMVNIYKAGA